MTALNRAARRRQKAVWRRRMSEMAGMTDRAWFANHPGRTHRLRKASLYEAVAGIKLARWVVVRRLGDRAPERIGFDVPSYDDDDMLDCEVFARAFFDTLSEAADEGRGNVPVSIVLRRALAMLPPSGRV